MASQASALGITVFAYAYTAARHRPSLFLRNPQGERSRGYTSAVLLAVIAIGIAWESSRRLLSVVSIRFDEAIFVAAIGLAVNLVCAFILRGDHDHHHATHSGDHNLRSAYLHVSRTGSPRPSPSSPSGAASSPLPSAHARRSLSHCLRRGQPTDGYLIPRARRKQ
jgi:hypothetical protein